MKSRKWIWWTMTILLTLIVLAGVGFAGYRVGMAQSANLPDGNAFPFHHGRGFDDGFGMRGFDHGYDFGMSRFNRGGFFFLPSLFGLIRLVVFGGLIWLGYTLIKRSGWRVVNVNTNQANPQSPTAPDAEGKKEEA